MSEKEYTMEELLKLAAEQGVELSDDMLDDIAGGAYDPEVWKNMTTEERRAAQQRSLMAKYVYKTVCEMD